MLKVIPRNHLSVKLVGGVELISPYLSSCPCNHPVRFESLHADIVFSSSPLPDDLPLNEGKYEGQITGAKLWFDDYSHTNTLIVTLDSPSLVDRHNSIIDNYHVDSANASYTPHVALLYRAIPNHQSFRWWYNEVIETFNGRLKGKTLTFQGEVITSSSMWIKDSTSDTGTPNSEATNSGDGVNTPML